MNSAPLVISQQEVERLEALHALRLLDTPAEPRFDRLTRLAASLFDVPTALISLIDTDRQWFKSRVGMDKCETPREDAFCNVAIRLPAASVMIVPDATKDPRFADNPHVTGSDHVRFYAGAVLTASSGHNLGTLCLVDSEPREFTDADQERLAELRDLVAEQIELTVERHAAQEKRQLLELAEAVSRVGHWRWRLDSGDVEWSDEVYRIYGLERGRRVRRDDLSGYYAPDDRAARDAFIRRVLRDGSQEEFETTIVRPDNERRRVVLSALRQIGDDGEVESLFGVVQDITERQTAIDRLRRSEARYRLLADHMNDVVTRLRPDGRSSYISPAITALLGYEPSEMAGRPSQDFVHPDDREELVTALRSLGDGGQHCTLQHRAVRKDGGLVWVETSFQSVTDEQGNTVEVIAVIRDISERRRLDEDLREARDRAEAASEAKSRFLANMSHELRTPLTSVIGFSRILQTRDSLVPTERQCADRIHLAAEALLAIINDILEFSKLEAGGVQLEQRPFELRALVRDAGQILIGQIEQKGLWYQEEVADGAPAVLVGDPARLRQVLLNFLGNAVKFTSQGGIRVNVGSMPLAGDRSSVRFAVSDTGPGIDPATANSLFERFVQADPSTSRRYGGTGLGLAICRELVELMDGRIGVDSVPGEGSTFWCEVPLRTLEQTP